MKFFIWIFSSIWVGLQIMSGQRKIMSLKAEKPPVPLVVFRQSSRFLVFWPAVLLTWIMALHMANIGTLENLQQLTLHSDGVTFVYAQGHELANTAVPLHKNPYALGGWWAVIICCAVIVLRVHMKAALTIALVALVLVLYFFLDRIGQWVGFINQIRHIRILGNWGMYALLAAIPTADILIVWLYARFHYFIATPNKGFLVWGMYASERPIEYSEHDFPLDVDDVVERTFGFGSFIIRPKSDPARTVVFPCVWRIAKKMSRFNEITTEMRVKSI